MYEYSMGFHSIEITPAMLELPPEHLHQQLTLHLGRHLKGMSSGISKARGPGWEMVSHNLTKLDDRLLISVLFRRTIQSSDR